MLRSEQCHHIHQDGSQPAALVFPVKSSSVVSFVYLSCLKKVLFFFLIVYHIEQGAQTQIHIGPKVMGQPLIFIGKSWARYYSETFHIDPNKLTNVNPGEGTDAQTTALAALAKQLQRLVSSGARSNPSPLQPAAPSASPLLVPDTPEPDVVTPERYSEHPETCGPFIMNCTLLFALQSHTFSTAFFFHRLCVVVGNC